MKCLYCGRKKKANIHVDGRKKKANIEKDGLML